MENLNDMCCYKIQAMKTARPSFELEKCRACSGYNECSNYIPIIRTEVPFRTGKFCVMDLSEVLR